MYLEPTMMENGIAPDAWCAPTFRCPQNSPIALAFDVIRTRVVDPLSIGSIYPYHWVLTRSVPKRKVNLHGADNLC